MPGLLGLGPWGDGFILFIIIGPILFFLSLIPSCIIGGWITDWLHWYGTGDDIFIGYCLCFCFWVVVISFGIFLARGNAAPEFLLRPLLWLLGWPEPHK